MSFFVIREFTVPSTVHKSTSIKYSRAVSVYGKQFFKLTIFVDDNYLLPRKRRRELLPVFTVHLVLDAVCFTSA